MVFINLKKLFDRVPREIVWWVLKEKNGIYIDLVEDIYDRMTTIIKTTSRETNNCSITLVIQQGSALS